MLLTKDLEKKVIEHLQKFIPFKCSICGGGDDSKLILDGEIKIIQNIDYDGTGIPVISLVCNKCGHVNLFDMKTMGMF